MSPMSTLRPRHQHRSDQVHETSERNLHEVPLKSLSCQVLKKSALNPHFHFHETVIPMKFHQDPMMNHVVKSQSKITMSKPLAIARPQDPSFLFVPSIQWRPPDRWAERKGPRPVSLASAWPATIQRLPWLKIQRCKAHKEMSFFVHVWMFIVHIICTYTYIYIYILQIQ